MSVRFLRRLRLPRKPFVIKVAKRGAIGVVLAYLAYLLVVNLALAIWHRLPLPDEVRVSFASAWSWYPGQVQARGIHIIGTDSHVQWQLDIEHAHFRMSLTDLLFHRRFHASGVRGSGIAMRIRQRLAASDATPAALAVLPPIEGLTDPPIKPAVPSPPLSDEDYNLWSVELEDVEAKDIREVWVDAHRFTGEAHATGGFALRPLRMARVGPISADITRGELSVGKDTALDSLSGPFELTVAPFDPRAVTNASVLRYVTIAVRCEGHVASLRFANHYWREGSEATLEGGAGPVLVDVRVVGGVLAAPSTVSLDSEQVVVTASGHRASASVRVALSVEAKERPEASVSSELTGLEVWQVHAPAPILRAARIVASGRSAELDLVRPFGDGTASVEIPGADVPDLRPLNEYLGKDVSSLRGGRAHLHATFSASRPARRAQGKLGLVADGLVVHLGDTDVHATGYANIVLGELDFRSWAGDFSGSRIEARDVVLSSAAKEPAWWGRVELQKAQLSLAAPVRFHTGVALQAKDGRPLLREAVPAWLADLISLDGLQGVGTVTIAASLLDVAGLHLKGGDYDIRGELDKRGQSSHGLVLAKSDLLTVGLELNDGSTSLKLVGAEAWYRRAVSARSMQGRDCPGTVAPAGSVSAAYACARAGSAPRRSSAMR